MGCAKVAPPDVECAEVVERDANVSTGLRGVEFCRKRAADC